MNSLSKKLAFFVTLLALAAVCLEAKPPDPTILIPTNAVWRYYDYGDDLAIEQWKSLNFIENYRWKSGGAELGYGITPEGQPVATTVSYGPDPNNKNITTYFRYRFVVTNLLSISNLTLTLQSLNGGVVYLNYTEIHRSLMPPGAVAYDTLALPAPPLEPGESPYLTRTIDRSLLNEGTNI